MLLPALLVGGCGDDGAAANDAAAIDATAIDASIADAGPPDAFDPCPGKIPFQVGMTDWFTGNNLPDIQVEQMGTSNSVISAPNGRVVLCLEGRGEVAIRISNASYVTRVHTTTTELARAQYSSTVAPLFRLLKPADAATLYSGAGNTLDAAKSTAIVMLSDSATGLPRAGASLSLGNSNDGGYTVGSPASTLVSGSTTDADGRVVFLNTVVGAGTSTVNVDATCVGPSSFAVEAGALSSIHLSCD